MTGKPFHRLGGGAIGMTLDADAFRLVRCNGQGRILQQEAFPLPEGLDPASDASAAFLKGSLSRFCGNWRSWPLWLCASTPGQQLRFMQLPRLRGRGFSEMVYWTFRKDIPFDVEKTVFDFGLHGGGDGDKVDVTVCTALTDELEVLLESFTRADISLCGIIPPSFALGTLLERGGGKGTGDDAVLVLHAGEELASVLVWQSGRVAGSRIFKTGLTPSQIRSVVEPGQPLEMHGFGSVLERLVQQVDRTMSAHLTAYPDHRFSQLVLTGPLAQVPALQESLRQQLGIETLPGGWALGETEVEGVWAPAAGAALSHYESTPNFLYPIRARDALQRRARMSFVFALLLGAGALALLVVHAILEHGNSDLRTRLAAEMAQLSVYDPEVNEEVLRPFVVQIAEENRQLKQLADRWHVNAVLQALARATPATLRIVRIELQMESTARRGPLLRVSGLSAGVPAQQLPVLAAYVLDLDKDPLFRATALRQVSEEEEGGRRVLKFEVEVELSPLGSGATATVAQGGRR